MDYRPIIESSYNRSSWQTLLHDIFRQRVEFVACPIPVAATSTIARQAYYLGKVTLSDGEMLNIYEVQLTEQVELMRNRVGIRNLLLSDWRAQGCAGAFLFCYRPGESMLRFSYVSEAWRFGENAQYEEQKTDTRRFTYLLGEGRRCRTAIAEFEKLAQSRQALEDVTRVFNIEAVSDAFFRGYKERYEDIIEYITGKRMVKRGNKWEETVTGRPCQATLDEFARFDDPEKSVRDYVKKLMGRLVFLQFLQKKGWMGVPAGTAWTGGDPEFLQNLFAHSNRKDTFIDDVLEPLFDDLNHQRTGDLVTSPEVNFGRAIKVPYLNGGLFEMDEADQTTFALPSRFIESLLTFFSYYNFTIDENDPDDAEIGVDPEMLGRIFENLLEDNKDKGAFYTPKEIVQYMCRESLIAYLTTYSIEHGNKNPREAVEKALRDMMNTPDVIVPHMKAEQKENFGNALRDVKICDPAIGSGAFPMGLLNELVRCRVSISAWAKDKDGHLLVDDYAALKREIISNNIYGVDIERGAIDIARLRFWLSIVVDEKIPHTLPNLDYKFMQGNSLITTFDGEYVNLDTKEQKHVNVSAMVEEKKTLHALKQQYYKATGEDKYKLGIQIKDTILRLVSRQIGFEMRSWVQKNATENSLFNDAVSASFQAIKQALPADKLRIINLAESLHKRLNDPTIALADRALTDIHFFDWRIMFTEVFEGEKVGFDIVIGNPPYVLIQTLQDDNIKNAYKQLYTVASYKVDLYHLFIELGYNIIKRNGILAYINPATYLTNNYNQPLRDLLLTKMIVISIINIENSVFKASVDTCIEFLQKDEKDNLLKYCKATLEPTGLKISVLSSVCQKDYLTNKNHIIQPITSNEAQALTEKIENKADILKEHASVNFGMQLRNRALYTTDVLVSPDPSVLTTFHRKCLTGKDINEYTSTWDNRYCYFNIEAKCGGCWAEEIHNAKNKILVRQVGATPICGIDTEGLAVLNSAFMVVCKDLNPFGVLAILNSTTIKFYWKQKFEDKRKTFPKIKGTYLELIPIAKPSSRISELGIQVSNLKKSNPQTDTSAEEHEIDRLVYQLYGLTNAEVKIIDPNEITTGADDDLFKA